MRIQAMLFMLLTTSGPTVPIGAAPPEIDAIRATLPEALIPGCVTPVFDRPLPGHLVCSLVARYFDDETATDLQAELDLAARIQYMRFMSVGRPDDISTRGMAVHGFQTVGVWWEDDALCGVYFVPSIDTGRDGADARKPIVDDEARRHEVADPTAAELLLKARVSRKHGAFANARDALGRLRREYPTSPEARRALRELFFTNTAESRQRTAIRETP